ncbi:MAG: hypothetical protein GQ526_03135 [Ardenticatenales bacterium]|nr:hypothetical protein [Ardenticatenales bacterium]
MSNSQLPEPSSWPVAEEADVSQPRARRTPPPLLVGAVVAGAIMLALFGALILRSLTGGDESEPGVPTLDPTTLSEYTLPATGSILVDGGTPQAQTSTPISITVKGLNFSILPYQVKPDGQWHYPAGQSGTAVWVYGTIINFVIGIEHTKANTAALESLAPGDEITMATSNGSIYHFGFSDRTVYDQRTDSHSADLFAQTSPGLTLVSLGGDGETRLVIHAEYRMAEVQEGTGPRADLSVAVGEPARLGEVVVTVLGTSYAYDNPNAPEGWALYLVDYRIENLSQQVLDPNRLRMDLQDGMGNVYSLNLPASQAGTFGYLMLAIPPNTVAQGTAGYLVPTALQGPKLGWTISELGAPQNVVKVLIDFEGPQEAIDPHRLAAVDLSGAELSGDRTLLSVEGSVLNSSESELVITAAAVTLVGAGNSMPLRAADPALPWAIPAGGVVSFRIAFQRPASTVATFTVLDQRFEIGGLE